MNYLSFLRNIHHNRSSSEYRAIINEAKAMHAKAVDQVMSKSVIDYFEGELTREELLEAWRLAFIEGLIDTKTIRHYGTLAVKMEKEAVEYLKTRADYVPLNQKSNNYSFLNWLKLPYKIFGVMGLIYVLLTFGYILDIF